MSDIAGVAREVMELELKLKKQQQEMEALWEHIHRLEKDIQECAFKLIED